MIKMIVDRRQVGWHFIWLPPIQNEDLKIVDMVDHCLLQRVFSYEIYQNQ